MAFGREVHWQVYDPAGRRKYLTDAERARFLDATRRLPPLHRALCYLLVYAGCRITEALSLQRHQLDVELRTVVIRTLKRRRLVFRTVPLPSEVVAMLAALPVLPDGRLWDMHRATAWRLVKRTMEAAAIDGPMACCRGLRHGFGMRAAARRVPQNLIQRWLGHSSGATTAIYVDAVGHEERDFASRMWSDRVR